MNECFKIQSDRGQPIDGRYQIEAQIGAGGMAAVYRARHVTLARPVALKLLYESDVDGARDARFEREARLLATVEHPNVVSVLDCGVFGGRPYLVMELLEGESLAARLNRGALPYDQAIVYAHQLLCGVAAMHAAGLVHRDLKPGNVFLQHLRAGGERVKLLDFGLAKPVDAAPSQPQLELTCQGIAVGTPRYMSPEQACGGHVDARSDVYALGLLLRRLFARTARDGANPEPASTRGGVTESAAPLDAALEQLIERALEQSCEARFRDAGEMLRAYERSTRVRSPDTHASQISDAEPELLPSQFVQAWADDSVLTNLYTRRSSRHRAPSENLLLLAGALLVLGLVCLAELRGRRPDAAISAPLTAAATHALSSPAERASIDVAANSPELHVSSAAVGAGSSAPAVQPQPAVDESTRPAGKPRRPSSSSSQQPARPRELEILASDFGGRR